MGFVDCPDQSCQATAMWKMVGGRIKPEHSVFRPYRGEDGDDATFKCTSCAAVFTIKYTRIGDTQVRKLSRRQYERHEARRLERQTANAERHLNAEIRRESIGVEEAVPTACAICGKEFPSAAYAARHTERKHVSDAPPGVAGP